MSPVDYALLAKRAYTDSPTVGKPDSASRMHAYGDVHVFRGTDDALSVLDDVDCVPTHAGALGMVHGGFWRALQVILPACLGLLPPRAVAGHSLGAALAILYAGVMAQRGHVVEVYAFEPPRICADDTLAELFRAKAVPLYATRNGNDIVTQVPPLLSLPGPLTRIGTPSFSLDNLTDHSIDRVIAALSIP